MKNQNRCCGCWDDSNNKFPPIRSLCLFGAFLFYIIDVGLDVYVAYEHYVAQQAGTDPYAVHYFHATLFFIVAPLVITNFISWALYSWGWLMYRSQKLKQICHDHSEKLMYTEFGESGNRTYSKNINIPVEDDIKVISWSCFKKSRGQNNEVNCVRTVNTKSGASGKRPSTDIVEEVDTHVEFYALDLLDTCEYVCVSLIHLFMLGYFFRVLRLFYKRKQDRYSFDRYRDISFLRLMEAFLESAPQLVLQLYIVVVREEARLLYQIITPISITVSTVSLALAVADYISAVKDLRYYDPPPGYDRKPRLSWTGYFLIIFWHLFMIAGRGLSFALFASIYGVDLFVVLGIHYAAMVYWMFWQNANVFIRHNSNSDYLDPRRHICGNYSLEFLVAAFNTFFHFKLKEGGSIETLVPFYTLMVVENTLMILLWYTGRDFSVHIWYDYPALVAVFVTFIVGLVCIGIYYYFFQPSQMDTLKLNPNVHHPTLTCTLNRMYRVKRLRGNFFQRLFNCRPGQNARKSSVAIELMGNRLP